MHSAAKAYGAVAQQIASPRNLEAQLLLRAASRLQNVHDHWENERASLDHALLYNRKLWSVFLSSATNKDNPLPRELRQNIANIGIFVMSQTVNVMGDPQPERLRSLININRQLAAGLSGHA